MHYSIVVISIVFIIYFTLSYNILNFLHNIQPTPYVDEIFHIPQGLKYCHGNFSEWDPKITTLPGLYILSFGVLRIFQWITDIPACNAYNLKLVNVLTASINFFLLYSYLSFRNDTSKTKKKLEVRERRLALWEAFNIGIFPVYFMFSFFYYTEMVSIFSILLMLRLHISKSYWSAGAIGICSVLIRQTNIVWVGYFLLTMALQKYNKIKFNVRDFSKLKKIQELLQTLLSRRVLWQQLHDGAAYILTCLLFLVFLYLNGGIVVGDRTAHQPVLHLPQLFYFSLFSIVFSFPHSMSKLRGYTTLVRNNHRISIFGVLVGVFIVYNFTMVHPYLLADNRHYSFYIWQRLYERHYIVRYLLIPVYYFGFYSVQSSLESRSGVPFWLCCLISLAPQKLLEFRYFLFPFILFRLQIKCKTWWILATESIFFICINIITFYIFATKEFYWGDSPEIQRLMW